MSMISLLMPSEPVRFATGGFGRTPDPKIHGTRARLSIKCLRRVRKRKTMKLWAILRVALRALDRNKMRSLLTMLGIVIGVGAVITMVSLGQGAQNLVQEQIQSMGTNILQVWAGSRRLGGVHFGAGSSATLTEEDVQAITRECPVVQAASPVIRSQAQMVFGNQNWSSQIQGTNEQYLKIRAWPIQEGDFFTEGDVRAAARVIVLGRTVAENLFPGINPVGQIL